MAGTAGLREPRLAGQLADLDPQRPSDLQQGPDRVQRSLATLDLGDPALGPVQPHRQAVLGQPEIPSSLSKPLRSGIEACSIPRYHPLSSPNDAERQGQTRAPSRLPDLSTNAIYLEL